MTDATPEQSKLFRNATTSGLKYRSEFYKPRKHSMPRRVTPSVNTTFVRMRQNEEGTIVMLPKVKSADFKSFKSSLKAG